MTIDLTQLAVALIGLLGTIVTVFIIPFLKAKINSERWRQLQEIASVAVRAAEQLGVTGKVKDKFKYAYDHITEEMSKRGLTWDESTIKAAIEAAVKQYIK